MKTYTVKKDQIVRSWYVVDAADQSMGRVAVEIAKILRGKHRPTFSPHLDTGDFVIVVNAAKVKLTGNKASENIYRHSGWPGALKWITRGDELAKKPQVALHRVVRGMLPHNRLGDAMIMKLKVYAGPEHPHEAQKPVAWTGINMKQGE